MSLEYSTIINSDLEVVTYNILDYDSININIHIYCLLKNKIIINNYQDILDWENDIKIPFENYYSEYLSNNLPPESFNGRESVYDYANNYLNGLDTTTFSYFYYMIDVEKYDNVSKIIIFYDLYSKNLIDVATNKRGINII